MKDSKNFHFDSDENKFEIWNSVAQQHAQKILKKFI